MLWNSAHPLCCVIIKREISIAGIEYDFHYHTYKLLNNSRGNLRGRNRFWTKLRRWAKSQPPNQIYCVLENVYR